MKTEYIVLNKERNVTLTAYLQNVGGEFPNIPKRPAVLVLPGGGYGMCSDREADPVAFAYLEAGYQVFILRYSVGNISWPQPLEDYEQAMELIRANADKWDLYADKVAVIGFSAGGHLAAAAATIARNKPNAVILGYPVIEGSTARIYLSDAPDLVGKVDAHTAPCFLFATRNDTVVPVSNALNFAAALDRCGVMFEMHIYPYGYHGFTVCNSNVLSPDSHISMRAVDWVKDSLLWLKDILGDFGFGEMTAPAIGGRVDEDLEEYYSVDCTVACLMENGQVSALIAPVMATAQEKMHRRYAGRMLQLTEEQKRAHKEKGMGMTLRSMLAYTDPDWNEVERLNEQLRTIRKR